MALEKSISFVTQRPRHQSLQLSLFHIHRCLMLQPTHYPQVCLSSLLSLHSPSAKAYNPPFLGPAGYGGYPNPPQVNPYSQTSPTSTTPYNPSAPYGSGAGYPPSTNGGQPYPGQNGYQGQIPVYYGGPTIPGQTSMHSGSEYPPSSQALPGHAMASYRTFAANDLSIHRMPVSQTQPTGMFTRNLIGSLSASAFRLTDPDDRIGIWFVLQDLSVRTEGSFR